MTIPGLGRKKEDAKLSAAERHARMAEEAMELGDPAAAAEHYRAALQFAPLSRELRQALAEALLEKALVAERRKSGAAPRSSAVLGEVVPEPAPAARRVRSADAKPIAKRRPESEPDPEFPRRKPSSTSPRPRRERAPGFSLMDDLEAEQPDEAALDDRETPLPIRPLPKARTTAPRAVRRRDGRRVWLMAAGYGAVLLIVAGLAHGVISHAMGSDALPTVAETAAAIPPELSDKLARAGELLAERKPAEAFKLLEGAKAAFPEHEDLVEPGMVQALRAEGSLHLQERSYAKAADAYERATRIDPLDKDNWIDLGRALREGGRSVQSSRPSEASTLLARAASAYERALDVSGKDPAALYGLAQVRIFLNDRAKAVDQLRRLIAVAPDTPEARQAQRDLEQLTGSKG